MAIKIYATTSLIILDRGTSMEKIPKGQIFYRQTGDKVSIRNINNIDINYTDEVYSEYQNEAGVAYGSLDDLITDLDDIIRRGGAGGDVNYQGSFTNYTALTTAYPAGNAGFFAFVENAEGTQWLPGSIGGSYFGAGWYYDTGLIWTNKNDAVFKELEPIQKQGFIDYNDTTGDVSLTADTWTTIPNNGLGSFTNKTYKPDGVTELMNTSTGAIDTSELALGDTIIIRNDFTVNPHNNNTLLEFRYQLGTGGSIYTLETIIARLDAGSGTNYRFSLKPDLIYMGDTNTKDNPIVLQVRLSSAGTLNNAGSVIQLVKGKL